MGAGIIISETEPELTNRYTWLKPLSGGGKEWYEPNDGGWLLVKSEPATNEHTHDGLDQLPDIITLLSNGITGSKTLGGYKFTFNHGVLVGFEPT